jgi:hypothetical protein
MIRRTCALAAGSALLGMLAACGSPGASVDMPPPSSAAAPSSTAPPSLDSPLSGSFDKPIVFADGVSIRITRIGHKPVDGDAAVDGVHSGDAAVRLTIVMTAGRKPIVNPAATAFLSYGDTGIPAPEFNDGEENGVLTMATIPSGTSRSEIRTFAVPAAGQARDVLVYTIDDHHEADFVGPVTQTR